MTIHLKAKQACARCTWVMAVALLLWGCQANPQTEHHLAGGDSHLESNPGAKTSTTVVARSGSVRDFPCVQCHDKIPAPIPIKEAKDRHHKVKLEHFAAASNCHICHAAADMNSLATLSGDTVSFDESYKLCGQCHSDKLKDFHIGAHGKSVGDWNGTRQRYSCTHCHDPHKPARPTSTALPAPPFPDRGIHKGQH